MSPIATKYFGELQLDSDSALHFPSGIPGFDQERRFALLQRDGAPPLAFLQSLSTPQLCFIVLPVRTIQPDYQLHLAPEDLAELELRPGVQPRIDTDVLCLALITIRGGDGPTANLLAPVVINLLSRRARQCIQADSGYSHQHPLLESAGAVC